MERKIKILAIAGSLRKGSYNRGLLRAAAELVDKEVGEIETFDIKDIPLFNSDLEANIPESVKNLKRKIEESDAILFATPEYNYSVSGVLKNAIDWASRPYQNNSWAGKKVAIMGASTGGFGTIRAQLHLRDIFLFLDMHPLNKPEIYVSKAAEKFDQNGNLTDEKIKKSIKLLLDALVAKINSSN